MLTVEKPSVILENANFKRLFDLSGDAMIVFGSGGFIYCNTAALNIYGCPSVEEFCTKLPGDFSPEFQPCGTNSRQLANQYIQEAIANGYARFEWVHQRMNGEQFYSDVLLTTCDLEGEPIIQSIVRDFSSHKNLQEKLRRQKELADHAAKAKSEFLAVMSHEIRTPIHGIMGAQELLMETRLDSEQRELGRLVVDSTRRLLSIVNDVLDFSKIDAGKLILEEHEFGANELVSNTQELFNVVAADNSLALVVELSAELAASEVRLIGDPNRIQQILSNLVSNAIKFTNPGGSVTVTSALQAATGGKGDCTWILSVVDTGIGMSEQQQQTVFNVFTQADSTITRLFGGTGLGLSISRALAELMGGSIGLSSKPGVGSTFTLTLPVELAASQQCLPSAPMPNWHRNYQRSVLVAEDNPTNQFIIRKKLSRLGLQPVIVSNGIETLEQYSASLDESGRSSFALILMDVQMPVLNGIEATRELRSRGCGLPIFALTADVQIERRDQCMQAGMQAFVTKPLEMSTLVDLLDKYLGA